MITMSSVCAWAIRSRSNGISHVFLETFQRRVEIRCHVESILKPTKSASDLLAPPCHRIGFPSYAIRRSGILLSVQQEINERKQLPAILRSNFGYFVFYNCVWHSLFPFTAAYCSKNPKDSQPRGRAAKANAVLCFIRRGLSRCGVYHANPTAQTAPTGVPRAMRSHRTQVGQDRFPASDCLSIRFQAERLD